MNRGKHLAYRNFIVKYHDLFISYKSPNKKELKKAIEQFWGGKHGWSHGKPKEEALCTYIIDHLLQEQEINSLEELRIKVEKIGYLRLHQPDLDQYEEKINEKKKDREVAPNKKVTGTVIENIRQQIIKQEGAEIIQGVEEKKGKAEEELRQIEEKKKQAEDGYRDLPTVLNAKDIPEPAAVPNSENENNREWWEDLRLKQDPFPTTDGFSQIKEELYERIAVVIPQIKMVASQCERDTPSFIGRATLVAGDYGTGKTTFHDYLAPIYVRNDLIPIILKMSANSNVPSYVSNFEKKLSNEIAKKSKEFSDIGDIAEGRFPDMETTKTIMQLIQDETNNSGFVVFLDELHKPAHDRLTVFKFLGGLQTFKDEFTREGIKVAFFVAGLPSWEQKIRQDSTLSGFFDSGESIVMPPTTPELAADLIKKRLEAFSVDPERPYPVNREHLASIIRAEGAGQTSKPGFREYITAVQDQFRKKNFDNILEGVSAQIPQETLEDISETLQSSTWCSNALAKLAESNEIKSHDNKIKAIKILVDIYVKKQVSDEDLFVEDNLFYFQQLRDYELIQKAKAPDDNRLFWKVRDRLLKLDDEIKREHNLSMDNYLLPVVFDIKPGQDEGKRPSLADKYDADISDWKDNLDKENFDRINTFLSGYKEVVVPYLEEDKNPHKLLKEELLRFRKILRDFALFILDYESPAIKSIPSSDVYKAWALRYDRSENIENHFTEDINAGASSAEEKMASLKKTKEIFDELWQTLDRSLKINAECGRRPWELPEEINQYNLANYNNLFAKFANDQDFIDSANEFTKLLEKYIRYYLRSTCYICFGGEFEERMKHYPAVAHGYIRDQGGNITTSNYQAYNEFEALNRGQYRKIFQEPEKKNKQFNRKIVEPVIRHWDPRSIDVLFNTFGDYNIARGHDKTREFAELKKNFKDYYSLGNRFIASMSDALKTLACEGDQEKFEVDPDEIELFFDLADNEFNAMKFDLFDLEALNIKYSKPYPEIVNMIRTLKSDSMAVPLSPYGGVVYLRKSRA